MLKLLTIRNFAVIEGLAVEFRPGLNLLTGETGSGKSIIVDALGLLLGDRSSLSQIRSGETSAFVEGIFELDGNDDERAREILFEAGVSVESEEEIVVRRDVNANGKSRIFVNDRSVSLSTLRKLQPYLVEIHGQGEQKLLRSARTQLELLDNYAGSQLLVEQTGEAYLRWKAAVTELQNLRDEASQGARAVDIMRFELSEIDDISPQEGEDEILARKRKIMAGAERIIELCGGAYDELYENDRSVLSSVANISRRIQDAAELDERLSPILKNLDDGAALLSEAASTLRTHVDAMDFSPEEFARVDNRLSEIERIKRKFGTDLKGIFEIRENLSKKLESLSDVTKETERLSIARDQARDEYIKVAKKLTASRKSAARKLEREVSRELQHVALEHAELRISLETADFQSSSDKHSEGEVSDVPNNELNFFTPYGADRITFLFSANPGEALRPLSQVASGGELSRLMLTLLTSSMTSESQTANIGTIIFDEIDSGIGGRVAEAVGRRLKSLAGTYQVLCVTHQPQIARFADAHFLVEKSIANKRTQTTVNLLDSDQRIREVARMIAGDEESKTTVETARWMVETAK